ncbi:hypothetical protein BK133_27285 [Paenibacillus sp. FSL H8-0548]|uniref:S-layer homology domain-containing protein n=1 Tax=Paenibacillus sp. FSL H8-0548 TaxID=1920422 RepID=UPI00096C2105|nr:S-layer homology domain-containing protein [Paenibacillus sp. FSL H8-0548]OMF22065.1 hypothetical protein BK133_27285 [Paenibacillus sp. FSL H8-0548]
MKPMSTMLKQWISTVTLVAILFGVIAQPALAEGGLQETQTAEPAKGPALMITEIVPDSKNVSSTDAYEFIEVYNNTDQPIDFKDYSLIYHYFTPLNVETSIPWTLSTDKAVIIPAHKPVVFWVKAKTIYELNPALTVAQFNTNYGSALEEDVNLFEIKTSGGLHNSEPRELIIQDKTGQIVSAASYENDDQTKENKGIFYSYPTDGSVNMVMMPGAGTLAATPGVINPAQVPGEPQLPPVITHTPVNSAAQTEDLTITAQIVHPIGHTVSSSVYYKQGSETEFTRLPMLEVNGSFQAIISKELLTEAQLNYYIEASDGIETARTLVYDVVVQTDQFDYSKVPPLLITELLPDSENVSNVSSDAFEFIEVYNNTDKTINFNDFSLVYRYPDKGPSADIAWELETSDDATIPSRRSIVIWVQNNANGHYTTDDFNMKFGTTLVGNSSLFRTKVYDGMANAAARSLVIKDSNGIDLVIASYQNDAQTVPDKGIFYAYPIDGSLHMKMMDNPGTLAATPGANALEQLPAETAKLPEMTNYAPQVTAVSDAKLDGGIEVTAAINDEKPLALQASIYYKTVSQQSFTSVPLGYSDGSFKALIPAGAVTEATMLYYIEANDGINLVKTAEYPVTVNKDKFDSQRAPVLLLTELVPDSTNIGGGDGYEFAEVYNNTDQPINLKDYKIRYRYTDSGPSADVIWPSSKEDAIIPAGGTVVFWVINSYNSSATAASFNANYGGSQLVEGVNLFKLYSDGMANGGKRAMVISTNSGIEITAAYYDNDEETKPDKGIFYKYPADGTTTMIKYSPGRTVATPGILMDGQAPAEPVHMVMDTISPVITDLTEVTQVEQSKTFDIVGDAKDEQLVKTVLLYYKSDIQSEFTKQYLTKSYDDGLYRQTIFSPELIGRESITYYFEISDGTNKVTTQPKQVAILGGADRSELRLNVSDNEILSGTKILLGAGETAAADELTLSIDGKPLSSGIYHAVERDAYFAFEVQGADYYFKNAVVQDKEILHTFLDPIPSWSTLSIPISADRLKLGENVLSIYAGSKSGPFDDRPEENKDDFEVRNVRLVLADGTEIYDPTFASKTTSIKMGDSAGKHEFLDFKFAVPSAKLSSKAYAWNTKEAADGEYDIMLSHYSAGTISRKIKVDNTAPTIKPSVEEGKEYRGNFVIDVDINDTIAGVQEVKALLDGKMVVLPYATSSAKLSPGAHTFEISASDKVGNTATAAVQFSVPDENPFAPVLVAPIHNTQELDSSVKLSVNVLDPLADRMNVRFFQGFKYDANSQTGFQAYRNAADVEPPKEMIPAGEKTFTADDYKAISEIDGQYLIDDSIEQFPYQRFEITLDSSVQDNDLVEISWSGKSLEGRMVSLYAWAPSENKWKMLDTTIAGNEDFELGSEVTAGQYRNGNSIQVMVQDQLPESDDPYDFSFVWMSDTQYYSETYFKYYRDNVAWIRDHEIDNKIKYVIHTGDIVDESDKEYQWIEADKNMKVLDDAKIPYGVLAGNHDVDHQKGSYTDYWKWFGDDRFKDQPTFGGSYKNNMGHYDLISAGGNDFIIVYMGWGLGDAEIDWMDKVVKQYPNRKAILALHEYLLVSGNRAPIADKVYERVVVPNKNVFATLSGHYHDAELKQDAIDDDGDGSADRTVYQMLADYQGAEDGGLGYMRLMQFDMKNNKLHIKTYSPTLDDYNYYDPKEFPGKDEFSLDLDLGAATKRVATDYFAVRVYTGNQIGEAVQSDSGTEASTIWSRLHGNTDYEWYAVAEDEHSGEGRSDIWRFKTGESVPVVTPTPTPTPTETPTEAPTATPSPTSNPVVPTPTAGSGNSEGLNGIIELEASKDGSYKLDAETINKRISSAAAGTVIEVKLLASSTSGTDQLEMSGEGMKALQQSGLPFRILSQNISLDIPAGAFPAAIAEASTVQLQVNVKETDELQSAVVAITGQDKSFAATGLVYTLELKALTSTGTTVSIHNFNQSIKVTRTLSPEELLALDMDYAGVYYLNGSKAEYIPAIFDGNKVTFTVNHFSYYSIFEYRKSFVDVTGHWAEEFVAKLAAKHAITGVDEEHFAPAKAITRADFAVIAVKALGFLEIEAGDASFADVASSKYYAAYVEKASELGLIMGYQGQFRPEDTITREEAAAILIRLYEYINHTEAAVSQMTAFVDIAKASNWARESIEAAKALGLINGKGGNLFDPKADVTRAEIAKMIWSVVK